MTCAVDAGRVIHPKNFTGQLEGGMDMGVGFALREQLRRRPDEGLGHLQVPQHRGTAFDMKTIVREDAPSEGHDGSVGIGEMTLVATAPAVAERDRRRRGRAHLRPAGHARQVKAALAASAAEPSGARDGAVTQDPQVDESARRRPRQRARGRDDDAGGRRLGPGVRPGRRPGSSPGARSRSTTRASCGRPTTGARTSPRPWRPRAGLNELDDTALARAQVPAPVLLRQRPCAAQPAARRLAPRCRCSRSRASFPAASSWAPGAWPACPTPRPACEDRRE